MAVPSLSEGHPQRLSGGRPRETPLVLVRAPGRQKECCRPPGWVGSGAKRLRPAGFEPTHPKIPEPYSGALDQLGQNRDSMPSRGQQHIYRHILCARLQHPGPSSNRPGPNTKRPGPSRKRPDPSRRTLQSLRAGQQNLPVSRGLSLCPSLVLARAKRVAVPRWVGRLGGKKIAACRI